ncbi:MAG: hypothetical protein PHW04_04210 [Candidatus Wallbacteria bacterium]|nr:hypothetical protein [Candidatus Wallbacteria bacterium]
MFRFTLRETVLIGVMGGVWGFLELTLGMVLHNFRVPYRGILLASLGFFVMLTLKRLVPRFGSILLAGLIAVAIKLLAANAMIANIMLAIYLEAIGWEFICHFLRKRSLLLTIFGGIYTGFVCSSFFIIGMMLFSGMKWEQVYKMYRSQAEFFTSYMPQGMDPVVVYLIFESMLALVFVSIAVRSSDRLIKRFTRFSGVPLTKCSPETEHDINIL